MNPSLFLYIGLPIVGAFFLYEVYDWIWRPKRRSAIRVQRQVAKKIAAKNSAILYIRYLAGDETRLLRYRQPWLARQFREGDTVHLWVKPGDLPENVDLPPDQSVHFDTESAGSAEADLEDGDTSKLFYMFAQLALMGILLFVGRQ